MSKTKLKVKGILLDLDGTIVDSKEAYLEAAKTAFQILGQKPPEKRTALEIPKRLEQKLPLSDIVAGDLQTFLDVYLKRYYEVTMEKTKPFPNIQNALTNLSRKAKLALSSRCVSSQKLKSSRNWNNSPWQNTSATS